MCTNDIELRRVLADALGANQMAAGKVSNLLAQAKLEMSAIDLRRQLALTEERLRR